QQLFSTTRKATQPFRPVSLPPVGRQVVETGAREADKKAWTLVAPSTITAMLATSSTGGAVNKKRRSNASAMMTANASASAMINNAAMTNMIAALPLDNLLHAKVMNHSTSTASGLSHPDYIRPTGRTVSTLKASKH